ncbi:hypothetical protein [Reinekea sp. G2M2-21]|uniref:hypothetical protein n=1 Tax=Reinekea sp. G2M2-21 TaxID=2788942 RepID=UPI0018AAB74B|nr:hypothetical protein [Reinekea sp. G2M2-21]
MHNIEMASPAQVDDLIATVYERINSLLPEGPNWSSDTLNKLSDFPEAVKIIVLYNDFISELAGGGIKQFLWSVCPNSEKYLSSLKPLYQTAGMETFNFYFEEFESKVRQMEDKCQRLRNLYASDNNNTDFYNAYMANLNTHEYWLDKLFIETNLLQKWISNHQNCLESFVNSYTKS